MIAEIKGTIPLGNLIAKYKLRPVRFASEEMEKRRVEFERAEGSTKLSGTSPQEDTLASAKELYISGQINPEEYTEICRQIIGIRPATTKVATPKQ